MNNKQYRNRFNWLTYPCEVSDFTLWVRWDRWAGNGVYVDRFGNEQGKTKPYTDFERAGMVEVSEPEFPVPYSMKYQGIVGAAKSS